MVSSMGWRRRESMTQSRGPGRLAAICLVWVGCGALAPASPALGVCTSAIASNFNGTAIPGGDTIWFNAVAKVQGVDPTETTVLQFDASQIAFQDNGTTYSLSVPRSNVIFDPAATEASTSYDSNSDSWTTTVPATYSGNVFLAGFAASVPASGLRGGINPVTWSGRFRTETPGLKVNWQWAAAVYSQFAGDLGALEVKPLDGTKFYRFRNSDHAGTPEDYRAFVIGGARGGGGSNFTGSYSGTAAVVPCRIDNNN